MAVRFPQQFIPESEQCGALPCERLGHYREARPMIDGDSEIVRTQWEGYVPEHTPDALVRYGSPVHSEWIASEDQLLIHRVPAK